MPITSTREAIAIIGIGCRFPGGVSNSAGFWRNLIEGVDAIGTIPPDRMDLATLLPEDPGKPRRIASRFGGYLEGIDQLDAEFFGLSRREAERLDPQQRLLMETSFEALEDAGMDISTLDGSRTGVFVGQWLSDFEAQIFADPGRADFLMTTGSGRYAASGRLSYLFGLRGPSVTIDTACSSSLVAAHMAMQSLRNGDCSLALAGGANVILQPHITIAYSASGMMAADGRCKFGAAGADGYVRSEGAGIVVLKRLSDALADGDMIYATIIGGAVNNDGRSSGSMGTPSGIGQQELLREACRDAAVDPAAIRYVEAHGTGTQVGDPVEFGALGAVLGAGRGKAEPLLVGSVKTNFGHTEGAAGVAGLIKTALSLNHNRIPASLNCPAPNPKIDWNALNCAVARETTDFRGYDRLAGVSAFGIAGTNAHLVLGAAPEAAIAADEIGTHSILPLSARSEGALRALAGRYAALLSAPDAPALGAVCRSAATRRTAHSHRAAFVAGDSAAMVAKLNDFAAGGPADAEGQVDGELVRIGFVAPGQGAQWPGMARGLMATEPVFRASIDGCDAAIGDMVDWSIAGQISADADDDAYRMDQIGVIQPVLVALAVAYADLLRSKGIAPDAVIGHSMGEVAAAAIAGVLDRATAMRLICRRSALMAERSGHGAMALVELSFAEAQARIAGLEDKLAVAASNSPHASILSGEPSALVEIMESLGGEGVFVRRVKVDVASHSPQMEDAARALAAEFADFSPAPATVPIYSTVLAEKADGSCFDAVYWARNLREPVRFAEAVAAMTADGISAFIELGPHPVLTTSVEQTSPAARTVCCGRRETDDSEAFLTALGGLWCAGASIDWRAVMPGAAAPVRLPTYPWQRERYWMEEADLRPIGASARPADRIDDRLRSSIYRIAWEASPVPPAAAASQRWLVTGTDVAQIEKALRDGHVPADSCELDDLGGRLVAVEEAYTDLVVVAGIGGQDSFMPLDALQRTLRARARQNPRLWFVTRGGQSVSDGEECEPSQAAIWGAARVIGEEHPELWGGLVDLPAGPLDEATLALLRGHLCAGDGEDQVAVRAGQRLRARLVREEALQSRPYAWRADSAYLLTGGLGGAGILIAGEMAAQGARRLILAGRTPLPPRSTWASDVHDAAIARRIAALRALERQGVSVHLATLDVGDPEAVARYLEDYTAEGWPPIRGVVHAAVSLNNDLAANMTRATFEASLRVKLNGAVTLERLLPDLEIFVLFSSIAGFLPHAGVANYAAANAGLDALAANRRSRGLAALSIAWGPWADAGLATGRLGDHVVAEFARQGISRINRDDGVRLFSWLTGTDLAAVASFPIDWAEFSRARAGRPLMLFKSLLTDSQGGKIGESFAARLPGLGTRQRRALLEPLVRQALGRVLKIPADRIDARRAFGGMGLNSLLAIELRNLLEGKLERPLSATLAWNYPNLEALVGHLAGDDQDKAAIAPVPAAEEADAVDALSEEETLAALLTREPQRSHR